MRKGTNHLSILPIGPWLLSISKEILRKYVHTIRYDTIQWSNGHWFRNLTDLITICLIKRYVSIWNGICYFTLVSFFRLRFV